MPQMVLLRCHWDISTVVYPVIFPILASLALKISITQNTPVVILFHYGESWNLLRADQRLIFAKSWPLGLPGINRDTRIYLFCEVIFRLRYLFGAKCVG